MATGIRRIAAGWQIRFTFAGTDYCKTVREPNNQAGLKRAIKEREEWVAEVTQGKRRTAELFADVAQAYLKTLDVKLSTYQTYRAILNGYWMPVLSTKPVHAIRPSTIREHLASLKVSSKTKRNIIGPLRNVFDLAVEEGYIDSNPVRVVRVKRHQKPEIERFTPAEKEKILRRLDGDERLYVLILFETGMRPGEVLALEWADFDGSTLRVSKAIVRRRQTDVKTHESRRVHCSPALRTALTGHPRRFQRGPILPNVEGKHHKDSDAFNVAWKRALEAARVPYRIPYTCRHTRAGEMLMAGVEPAYAAKQLGHSLEMFFRTYAAWIHHDRDAIETAKLEGIA